MSKEYLDRKEVDNILTDIWDDEIVPLWEGIITATEEIRIQKSLDKLVDKICKLKPKNQIVIAEGEIKYCSDNCHHIGMISINDDWGEAFTILNKLESKKAKGKLIFIEEK